VCAGVDLSVSQTYLRIAAAATILCPSPQANSGPPLATEDPGILDPGQWEIITAVTSTSNGGGDYLQVPVLDVSVGLIADFVQISVAYPYVNADPDDGDSEWDFGNLEVGVKWRFFNSETLQLAIAPVYAFGVTRSTAEKGIGEDTEVLVLPLAAEYQFGETWRLNASAAYAHVDDGGDEWGYSTALAYTLDDRWELLFELTGATESDFDDDVLDLRAGFDFSLIENVHLLFSAATGLREEGPEDELDYDIYLGLQFFF